MAFGRLIFTFFVGWKMKKETVWNESTNNGTQKFNCALFSLVYFLIKWVAPLGIVIIFITNLVL